MYHKIIWQFSHPTSTTIISFVNVATQTGSIGNVNNYPSPAESAARAGRGCRVVPPSHRMWGRIWVAGHVVGRWPHLAYRLSRAAAAPLYVRLRGRTCNPDTSTCSSLHADYVLLISLRFCPTKHKWRGSYYLWKLLCSCTTSMLNKFSVVLKYLSGLFKV